MSDVTVEKIGGSSYRIALGDDEVVVRGSDPDACIARGIEILSETSGVTLIPRREGDIVIDVPKFESSAKAATPVSKKG